MASLLNHTQEPMDILLHHPTYLSLVLPYLPIKCIFSTIVLLSKYQLSFMTQNHNKKIIQRLITSQIGSIFTISQPFTQYYFHTNTNPYKLIPTFYTNFGFIEQIGFPKHHQKIGKHCIAWQHRNKAMDWDSVEVSEVIDDEDEYNNPFDWQYNAIKYHQIPFDFVILLKLKKAQLVISWLTYILNQDHINCHNDLNRVFLNTPEESDPVLNWKCKVLMITAIANNNRTGSGYSLNTNIIRNICDWPSDEFAKLMRFILLHNARPECLLRYSILYCCAIDDVQLGVANYCIVLELLKSTQMTLNLNLQAIFETVYEILCINITLRPECTRMFRALGAFLMEHVDQKELHDENEYYWAEVGRVEYRKLFLDLLGFE
eukprot:263070_1